MFPRYPMGARWKKDKTVSALVKSSFRQLKMNCVMSTHPVAHQVRAIPIMGLYHSVTRAELFFDCLQIISPVKNSVLVFKGGSVTQTNRNCKFLVERYYGDKYYSSASAYRNSFVFHVLSCTLAVGGILRSVTTPRHTTLHCNRRPKSNRLSA